MILGQLIQTGRRFCECRSHDFVPKTEGRVVVVAYTIHDEFLAHSFDLSFFELKHTIKTWLARSEAVAYLLIRRKPHGLQHEFPAPIGRDPMDKITLTAATQNEFKAVSFYLEEIPKLNAFRLLPTACPNNCPEETGGNLLRFREERRQLDTCASFPEFSEFFNKGA